MGGFANQKTYGDKGSNANWQFRVLQLLAATPSGGGLATEATLMQVLTALQNGQEFEQNLVIDKGGAGCPGSCPTYLQVRIFNTETHAFDPPIYYDASGSVVVPVGPLELVNNQYILQSILNNLTPVTRYPALTRESSSGTVPAGARSVSFYNAGPLSATVLTATLKRGEQISFDAGSLGDTLDVIAFDATGTDLVITIVV